MKTAPTELPSAPTVPQPPQKPLREVITPPRMPKREIFAPPVQAANPMPTPAEKAIEIETLEPEQSGAPAADEGFVAPEAVFGSFSEGLPAKPTDET